MIASMKKRCAWCGEDALYSEYHDLEWGVPCRDEAKLFEMLNLEGAQAGLSWITILRKREGYREAFDQFDPLKIVHYNDEKKEQLRSNEKIVRNKLKIEAVVQNARAWLALKEQGIDPVTFLWSFTDGEVIQNSPSTMADVPAQTERSQAMSKALKKCGFKFVGPTICYAFMQACGMVNDHTTDCFRYKQ